MIRYFPVCLLCILASPIVTIYARPNLKFPPFQFPNGTFTSHCFFNDTSVQAVVVGDDASGTSTVRCVVPMELKVGIYVVSVSVNQHFSDVYHSQLVLHVYPEVAVRSMFPPLVDTDTTLSIRGDNFQPRLSSVPLLCVSTKMVFNQCVCSWRFPPVNKTKPF